MWGLCGRLSHRGYLPAVTAFNSGHDEGLSGLSREAFDSFRSAGAEFGVDKSSNGFQKLIEVQTDFRRVQNRVSNPGRLICRVHPAG
jgi:hypothetical protein